jgi:hypothetical protein
VISPIGHSSIVQDSLHYFLTVVLGRKRNYIAYKKAKMMARGGVELMVKVGGYKLKIEALVMEQLEYDVYMGLDVLGPKKR